MNIAKIHIDGFGTLHTMTSPDPMSAGLSLIYGDNEAGKSTILAFLRAVLFGFPDGRSTENLYQPLAAAPHGGVITLATNDGDLYVVERHRGQRNGRARVTLQDGRIGDEKRLTELLGFATRDLFRNIFAFSLTELQQFQSLSDEAVRTAIYSAGIGTGRLSVSEIDKELEGVQTGLFKPGGTSPTINRKLKRLDEVRAELRATAENLRQFDHLRSELVGVEAEIVDLRARKDAASRQHDQARRLLGAFDDWVVLRAAEVELARLPDVAVFPADGLAQLATGEQKLDGLAERIEQVSTELRDREAERATTVVDERVEEQGTAIERLQRGRDHFDSAVRDLPVRRQELKSAEERLADSLIELGPDWSEDRVKASNTSVPEREAIRSHREALRDAETAIRDCEQRSDLATKSLQAAAGAEQEASGAFAALPTPAEKSASAIAGRRRDLRSLLLAIRDQKVLRERSDQLTERETDLVREKERLLQQLKHAGHALPPWPAVAAFLLGVLLAAVLFAQGAHLAGVLIGLVFALALPAAYLALNRQLARQREGDRRETESQLEDVGHRLTDISTQRVEAERDSAQLKARISATCEHLGIVGIPDDNTVEAHSEEAEAALEGLREWIAKEADLKRAAERVKAARQDVEEATRSRKAAEDAALQARARWTRWLSGAGLRQDITPDGALDIINVVRQCREQSKAAESLRERIGQIDTRIQDYRRQVSGVAERCGIQLSDSDDPGIAVDRLMECLQVANQNRVRRTALDERFAELRRESEVLRGRKETAESARNALFSSGGASDAAEFRERGAVWSRRQELLRDAAQRNIAIERIAGQGEHLAAFKHELGQMVPAEQEAIVERTEEELREIEDALAKALENGGALREQIRSLEVEDRSAKLRAEEQGLLTELRAAARAWAVHAVARALLGEAKERYERERQPGVIRDASIFFKRITRDQYTQILVAPEEFSLHVLDADGHRKHLQQLSRGTLEQLYLAVRLGLIREFSRRQERLPVVMDDILVNFDPHRAEAALGVLLELGQTHQILLFTCHPETCDLVSRLSPLTPIYRLDRSGLTLPAAS